MMKPIRIPSIYCPFPAQISPYVEAVHEHSLAWTTRFHLIQKPVALRRFLASRFAWLTTRAYHSAGLEELKLMNDWLVWLFLFDDQFDDSQLGEQPKYLQALLNDYSAIITNPRAAFTPSPAAEAIADLCQRSFSHM